MEQENFNTSIANYEKNQYLYNGKELQDEGFGGVSLGWLDYGARMYDPVLGRFHTLDPLCEWEFKQTPYTYAGNNPVRNIDYMGMSKQDRVDRRNERRERRELRRCTNKAGEFVVYGSKSSQQRRPQPGKRRDATDFEYWKSRTFDQSMVSEIASIFGHYIGPTINNVLDYRKAIKRYYTKKTSDKRIIETSTGSAVKTKSNGRPIDKTVDVRTVTTKTTYSDERGKHYLVGWKWDVMPYTSGGGSLVDSATYSTYGEVGDTIDIEIERTYQTGEVEKMTLPY